MSSGTLYIVAAPSGAGKTTLVRGLLERDPHIHLSVSYTTRAPRSGEVNGVAYHFVDVPTFTTMRERNEFVEWAEVHGNFYGTSQPWLTQALATGDDVLLEIDWQGAQQVRKFFPQAVGIFIMPPSIAELERRLNQRGTDSEEVIARRVAAALDEMRHVDEFDYVIVNDQLAVAQEELIAVVKTQRLRYLRQREVHTDLFAVL